MKTKQTTHSGQFESSTMELLGYAGLIPFFGLVLVGLVPSAHSLNVPWANWIWAYGVVIASFMGAIHWGLALGVIHQSEPPYLAGMSARRFETQSLVWSVCPALLVWFGWLLLDPKVGLALTALVLVTEWVYDVRVLKPLRLYDRYLKLRTKLSLGAASALLMAAWMV